MRGKLHVRSHTRDCMLAHNIKHTKLLLYHNMLYRIKIVKMRKKTPYGVRKYIEYHEFNNYF